MSKPTRRGAEIGATEGSHVTQSATPGESSPAPHTEPPGERAEFDEEGPEGLQDDALVQPQDSVEVRSFRCGAQEVGLRLDRVLALHVDEFSRSYLQSLIERGCVTVNGAVQLTASRKPAPGAQVSVRLELPEESRAFVPEDMDLQVLWEDEHLLVMNKPVGRVVHPAPGHWRGTVLNGLLAHHAGAASLPRAGIVHRLDKDTSGVMVVAKTLQAMTRLSEAIALREVRREYLAVTAASWGQREPCFWVDAPIGRDPVSRVKMAVVMGGREAQTLVARLWSQDGLTGVHCRLKTGRTHQIRVHMAHSGLPLAGDVLYGGKPHGAIQRQALHAWRLSFTHPVSGEAVSVLAPLPADLAAVWPAGLEPEAMVPADVVG